MANPNVSRPSQARVGRAVEFASDVSGVSTAEIMGDGRTRRESRARWLAWRELREAGFGYAPIANAWGCDHTSIMNAERRGWGVVKPTVEPLMIWGRAA